MSNNSAHVLDLASINGTSVFITCEPAPIHGDAVHVHVGEHVAVVEVDACTATADVMERRLTAALDALDARREVRRALRGATSSRAARERLATAVLEHTINEAVAQLTFNAIF